MSQYVLCPIVHGVELKPIPAGYATPLIEGIAKYLTEEERGYFIPLPYNYSVRTDARQMEAFKAVEAGLGNRELRRLKHTVGSDVTWSFITAKDGKPSFYSDFASDLAVTIENAINKYPISKIVCLGHSQGTQLLYSFMFDATINIEGFISLGSPISMNSGAWENWGKVPPIKWWLNFYNDMDFVSSKLQGVHPSPAIASFVQDFNVPLGWNPLYWLSGFNSFFGIPVTRVIAGLKAHVCYWSSDFVHRKIAEKIKTIINQ